MGNSPSHPIHLDIPVQKTFFYTAFGRRDHIKKLNSLLVFNQFTPELNALGTFVLSSYGRQICSGVPYNSALDHKTRGQTPIQVLEEYGNLFRPQTFYFPTDGIDHDLLIGDGVGGNGGDGIAIPNHIPITILTSGPALPTSTVSYQAPKNFRYDVSLATNDGTGEEGQERLAAKRAAHSHRYAPIGVSTRLNGCSEATPVQIKWSGKPYWGRGESGVKSNRELFGSLYQPPTTTVNIVALEHYDFNYLSELSFLNNNPTVHMGHLLVLNLAAESGIVCLTQFIHETHQIMSKGCVYPLLDSKVTVVMLNSEQIDALHIQPREVKEILLAAGFLKIDLLDPMVNVLPRLIRMAIGLWLGMMGVKLS